MGLQVWLPLDGNLSNQGFAEVTLSSGSPTYTNGKIGQCLSTGNLVFNVGNNLITNLGSTNTYSMCCWCKDLNTSAASRWVFSISSGDGTTRGLWENNSTANRYWAYSYSGVNLSTSINTIDGNWHHICFTSAGSVVKLYVDGIYQSQVTSASTTAMTANIITLNANNYNLNDFRLYDTVLSPREIKEISKGLVLHYPLSMPGGENIFTNSNLSITSGSNTTTVKIGTSVPVGTTVTLSVQVDADNVVWNSSSNYRRIGFETNLARTDISGTQYIGAWAGDALNTGQNIVEAFTGSFHGRVSKTFTTLGELTTSRTVGLYVQGVSSGTVKVSNPKLEIGDHATPWVPNTADALYTALGFNDGIEYDVSGYGYNGTKTGAFAYDADTPRYNTSTRFNQTDTRITPPIIFQSGAKIPEISFSFWMKRNDYTDAKNHYIYNDICQIYTYSDYLLRISWKHDTESSSAGNTSASSTAITTPNEWHHICYTFDKGILRLYIDGEFKYGSDRTDTGQFMGVYNFRSIGYASGSNISYGGCLSDFRIYATALSADDILELYHTPISLSNNGVLLTQGEYVEG